MYNLKEKRKYTEKDKNMKKFKKTKVLMLTGYR